MRFTTTTAALAAALFLLLPAGAHAQFEGLDLTGLDLGDDSQSAQKASSPASASDGASDMGGFGLDLNDAPESDAPKSKKSKKSKSKSDEDKVTPEEAPAKTPQPAEMQAMEGRLREIELTADDRVKSVQPRGFLKDGRFEVMPIVFVTLNDSFYPKYGPGLRLAYHVHESFGIALRANQYNIIPNDNVRLAKRQLRSQLPDVQPKFSFALDMLWSPFYGKAKLGNSIRHFDLYVAGGLGAVLSESLDDEGVLLATHLGLGSRFSLNDFIALDLSLLETVYVDKPQNAAGKGIVQHIFSINLGLSFFFPFSFEYKE